MNKRVFLLIRSSLLLLTVFTVHIVSADDNMSPWAMFCADLNVVGPVDTNRINRTIDTALKFKAAIEPASGADKFVGNIVSCNLPGDEFQICRACQDEITDEQMKTIIPMLTSKAHKVWHEYWHRFWNLKYEIDLEPAFDVMPADLSILEPRTLVTFELLSKSNWLPSKGVSDYIKKHSQFSGESFLYMHRQMIKMVNLELSAHGLPCIQPWKDIQPLNSTKWPVPRLLTNQPQYEVDRINGRYAELFAEYTKLSDPEYLKAVSLDVLGFEAGLGGLHGLLHGLYRDPESVKDKKCEGDEYTSRTCDDLRSDVSSHVNRHFWKLHGLIDDLIGKWLIANGFETISEDCKGKEACYQWEGTYLGVVPDISEIRDQPNP